MSAFADWFSPAFLGKIGRAVLVSISGLSIAFVFENFADEKRVARAAAFQCARLNDVSQFNPRRIADLAWRSAQPPGPISFAFTKSYVWSGEACVRSNAEDPAIGRCRLEGQKAVQAAIAADKLMWATNPPKGSCVFANDSAGIRKRICELEKLRDPFADKLGDLFANTRLKDKPVQHAVIGKSAEDNCLRKQPDKVAHWAYLWLAGIGKIAQPLVALADVAWHNLFDLSWSTAVNWLCLVAGFGIALPLLDRFEKWEIPPFLVIGLFPIAAIVAATAIAFAAQYIAVGVLHAFGGVLKLSLLALGGPLVVQLAYEVFRRTGEHLVSEKAKDLIDQPKR